MLPLARNTISRTTSPSIFRVRHSAVYSGRGLSRMLTGVVAPSLVAALFLGASVGTARSVAVSRTARQCLRTKAIDVRGFVWITISWDSVGIAEAAGLHFVHRGHDRRRGCAA